MTGSTDRGGKVVRVVAGIMAMAAVVLITFGILARFAGGWGVPFFTFTTDNGSTCTNTFSGHVCDQVTPADIAFWSDVTLPPTTTVTTATYTVTHDYELTADLAIGKAQAAAGLKDLRAAFGPCKNHPSPLDLTGLTKTCVMTNDDFTATADGEQASRLFLVGTGVRKDGTRLVSMTIRSR
ncbi:MAG: hypothetical protein ACR2LI_17180 [Propionibacteriaceae bacterium]